MALIESRHEEFRQFYEDLNAEDEFMQKAVIKRSRELFQLHINNRAEKGLKSGQRGSLPLAIYYPDPQLRKNLKTSQPSITADIYRSKLYRYNNFKRFFCPKIIDHEMSSVPYGWKIK